MAYAKKSTKNEAYQKLKTDLKDGNALGNAYLFYGEESYLREYYLGQMRKALVPAGFEEFNYHALEGKDLTAQSLTEMAEAMPMMAERTLIVVTDWDIYKLNEDQRERFIALLEDLPDIEVLAAGHHGSKDSTSAELLRALTPELAVISVGSNSYGHPTEDALRRLVLADVEIYRTDKQGTVHLSVN